MHTTTELRQKPPQPEAVCFVVNCSSNGQTVHQRWLKTFTLFASEEDNAASLIPIRPPITEVGSEAALRKARQMLETCRNTHESCPTFHLNPLPTRAIDVGANNGEIKLHCASFGEEHAYTALSYCWGGPQPVLLTMENLEHMTERVHYELLPQTIKDAIKVTRSLGIRYLWVDAICIIQDEDEEAKSKEIGQMGKIYKNAAVTIFAASAGSAADGFLHSRPTLVSSSLPLRCADGTLGVVHLAIGESHNIMGRLVSRGWTLQETLLSPRKLVYGEKELVWDCETNKEPKIPSSYYELASSFRHLPPETFVRDGAIVTPSTANRVWCSLLNEYAKRQLSFPEDRLAAVMGVIAELKPIFRDECLHGLWRQNFVSQLSWFRDHASHDLDADAILECAPEWSWASRVFPIDFVLFEPDATDEWQIIDRRLMLHRKLRPGRDVPRGSNPQWQIHYDFLDPREPYQSDYFCLEHNGMEVYYLCLCEHTAGNNEVTMAVVQVEEESVFRRVGIVINQSSTSWFEGVHPQKVTLI
ncbi:unnamed protein product [Clonostachys rosea]|uniref:Heterokaryon incompatibility domain-containing protein n=1 Tax=Bionectria ochroleuca TaxID=29856 RepID=A0ABY6U2X5_BIOOC|nr:unnamed protein product [Clonostachys rosea]